MALKQMPLRYAGVCRVCSVELPARSQAVYDTEAKNVVCLECRDATRPADGLSFLPPPQPIDHGVAGAGPQAEYERRVAKREAELRAIPGIRGKLARAFDEKPTSTTAWRKGAVGEARLAAALASDLRADAISLHSRKVPKTRGDIDHLIVAPSGVWVVDAKHYRGRVERRDQADVGPLAVRGDAQAVRLPDGGAAQIKERGCDRLLAVRVDHLDTRELVRLGRSVRVALADAREVDVWVGLHIPRGVALGVEAPDELQTAAL